MCVTAETQEAALDRLERQAFTYFSHEVDASTGLVRDNTRVDAPASIAGSGFGLACYAVAAERGYVPRADAAAHVQRALTFLWEAPQGDGPTATGSHGFFYHFLALDSGRRVWQSEVSTIDTAIALAGALTAGEYFNRDTPAERSIRDLTDRLVHRADWLWSIDGGSTVSHGWRPESGFLRSRWQGYSEALILYVLGLGSPTRPLPAESFRAWTTSYRWRALYGHELLYAGPLFIHQLSHCWIDFRGIRDAYMRDRGIDYFENSRRATYVQRAYATRNPKKWTGYSATNWGITASDGPGPASRAFHGSRRRFYGYHARGVPFGPDDGTLSPCAVVASLPFAPEIVLPCIASIDASYPEAKHGYGYTGSINPSFRPRSGSASKDRTHSRSPRWSSPAHYAINQGPVVLMIENYRSGLVWRLMSQARCIVTGLRRAGFEGGWLG